MTRRRVVGPSRAAEEPLAIELDGTRVATTMRTPGNDFELAVGFCHNEGLLAGHSVVEVSYRSDGSAAASAFNIVVDRWSRPCTDAATCHNDLVVWILRGRRDRRARHIAPVVGEPLDWDVLAAWTSSARGKTCSTRRVRCTPRGWLSQMARRSWSVKTSAVTMLSTNSRDVFCSIVRSRRWGGVWSWWTGKFRTRAQGVGGWLPCTRRRQRPDRLGGRNR